jgi:hypothetical protein
MDWIKVKHSHVPSNMTDAELGKVVKFQLEIARLERQMTPQEKMAFFGRKEAQKSWESVKEKHQICEDFVTKKVLEDCESVKKLRQRNKGNQANSRLSRKVVTSDSVHFVTEQIREDKIREDKSVCSKEDTPHTFFKMAYRIFRLRKRRSTKPIDAGLLRHLIDLSHKSEERSAWAVEIEEYRRKLIKKRKDSLESRGKRTSNDIEQIESSKKEEIKRAIIQRYDSLPINVQSGVLDAAYEKYKLANGELRFIDQNKARKEFLKNILSSYISEVMSEMKEGVVA